MISKLAQCVKCSIIIHVMTISKQAHAVDCALFAMAPVISLALGIDNTFKVLKCIMGNTFKVLNKIYTVTSSNLKPCVLNVNKFF